MKRFGLVTMVMVGFIAGIAFVYSCGGSGGGNPAIAQPLDASYIRSTNLSFYAPTTKIWVPHSGSESFIITDLETHSRFTDNTGGYIGGCNLYLSVDGGDIKYVPGRAWNSADPYTESFVRSFESGIHFSPSETISIKYTSTGDECSVFLSGYIVPN